MILYIKIAAVSHTHISNILTRQLFSSSLIFMYLFSEHINLSSQRIENRHFTQWLNDGHSQLTQSPYLKKSPGLGGGRRCLECTAPCGIGLCTALKALNLLSEWQSPRSTILMMPDPLGQLGQQRTAVQSHMCWRKSPPGGQVFVQAGGQR